VNTMTKRCVRNMITREKKVPEDRGWRTPDSSWLDVGEEDDARSFMQCCHGRRKAWNGRDLLSCPAAGKESAAQKNYGSLVKFDHAVRMINDNDHNPGSKDSNHPAWDTIEAANMPWSSW
jgi:hypothetical protein